MNAVPSLVVFDLDDTLYAYEPCHAAASKAWTRFAEDQLNVTAQAWLQALGAARAEVKARIGDRAASHSRLLYAAGAVRQLGFGVNPTLALALEQEYWRAFLITMRLRDGVSDLIAALRYSGVPLAIVTDLTMQIQLRKLIRLGIDIHVDYLVTSEECPSEKPHGDPFEVLFAQVPEEARQNVWFIGDAAHDVPVEQQIEAGTIAAGRGFLLSPRPAPPRGGVERVAAVGHIEDVLGALTHG